MTWSQFHVGPGAIILSAPILASVTHDSGNTWTDPVQISGSLPFGEASVPVMAADGSIYVAFTAFQNANDIRVRDPVITCEFLDAKGKLLATRGSTVFQSFPPGRKKVDGIEFSLREKNAVPGSCRVISVTTVASPN